MWHVTINNYFFILAILFLSCLILIAFDQITREKEIIPRRIIEGMLRSNLSKIRYDFTWYSNVRQRGIAGTLLRMKCIQYVVRTVSITKWNIYRVIKGNFLLFKNNM